MGEVRQMALSPPVLRGRRFGARGSSPLRAAQCFPRVPPLTPSPLSLEYWGRGEEKEVLIVSLSIHRRARRPAFFLACPAAMERRDDDSGRWTPPRLARPL